MLDVGVDFGQVRVHVVVDDSDIAKIGGSVPWETMEKPKTSTRTKLHDDAPIEVEVVGQGPPVLLPVNPRVVEGSKADEMRRWGTDPALGAKLIDALAESNLVIAADYEGHVLANPKPDTLTPANVVADLLAIADAAGAERFNYYGYSWLAVAGLQLAVTTDRLTGLAMGGFPPLDGPYREMLVVTRATHQMTLARKETSPSTTPSESGSADDFDWDTAEIGLTEPETRQFVTLYTALADFDDRAAQRELDLRRHCFVGTADRIDYGPRWDNVTVDLAGPVVANRAELESLGWRVRLLDGLDHTQAMQPANVIPILMDWLGGSTEDS